MPPSRLHLCPTTRSLRAPTRTISGHPVIGTTVNPGIIGCLVPGFWLRLWARFGLRLTGRSPEADTFCITDIGRRTSASMGALIMVSDTQDVVTTAVTGGIERSSTIAP